MNPKKHMSVSYVIPPENWSARAKKRALKRIKIRFSDELTLLHSGEKPCADNIYHELSQLPLQNLKACKSDILVIWKGYRLNSKLAPNTKVYVIDTAGCLLPLDAEQRNDEHPLRTNTIFGRLAGSSPNEFKFFPYGFLGFHPGRGEIDEFGFRINFDYRSLAQRDSSHKVVAIFGGSTAFSTHCHDDEMFSTILENQLNDHFQNNEDITDITVLNFGQVGAIVLQNITAWMLFCGRINPDIVVCHTGWNDLCLGLGCDPQLLAERDICYLYQFEEWAQILHGTTDEPRSNSKGLLKNVNTPDEVIDTWLFRVSQFALLVQGMGGIFLCGFQPALCSKAAPHENERAIVEQGANNPDLALAFERMPTMMNLAEQAILARADLITVNLHQTFSNFGTENELFADRIHCWPEGDAIIAHEYATKISNILSSGEV